MAEGVVAQIKDVPGEIKHFPWLALGIGFLFLFLVLLIEAWKPGLITGPIRALLHSIGVAKA